MRAGNEDEPEGGVGRGRCGDNMWLTRSLGSANSLAGRGRGKAPSRTWEAVENRMAVVWVRALSVGLFVGGAVLLGPDNGEPTARDPSPATVSAPVDRSSRTTTDMAGWSPERVDAVRARSIEDGDRAVGHTKTEGAAMKEAW